MHEVESLAEEPDLPPGATDLALRRYGEFLGGSRRGALYPQRADCTCRWCEMDDVTQARDVLDIVMGCLPPRARGELRALVAPLDVRCWLRTLPDPFLERRYWCPEAWWHHRLFESHYT